MFNEINNILPLAIVDTTVFSPDLKCATPIANFAAQSKIREINIIDNTHALALSAHDYTYAKQLAQQLGLNEIIALGCGDGAALLNTFPATAFKLYGFDFPRNLISAKKAYPQQEWLECHLGSINSLHLALKPLQAGKPKLIILSDIITAIADPRPLLAELRELLFSQSGNRLVIITQERTDEDFSPTRIRQWTLAELGRLLISCGFKIEKAGYIPVATTNGNRNCYVELSCSVDFYQAFLQKMALPNPLAANALVIAVDHPQANAVHKDIATYLYQLNKLDQKKQLIFLNVNRWDLIQFEKIKQLGLQHPYHYFEPSYIEKQSYVDQVFITVSQVLFYYPNIRVVEYQDYLGIGVRIAQAKQTGLIKDSIIMQVLAHGSHVYLENSERTWYGYTHLLSMLIEKISLERADRIIFPTQFIKKLYQATGYLFAEENCLLQRLPYLYEPIKNKSLQDIDTLIFFGEQSYPKGFYDFLRAIRVLMDKYSDLFFAKIKNIVIIGDKSVAEVEAKLVSETETILPELKNRIPIIVLSPRQVITVQELSKWQSRSLVLLPYIAENHPYAVCEVINQECDFLAYNAGGIPELIPEQFHDNFLSQANFALLAENIAKKIVMDKTVRTSLVLALKTACMQQQTGINNNFLREHFGANSSAAFPPVFSKNFDELGELVSVIVPVYNTKISYIEELCFSFNNQVLLPKEIIFINDGSKEGYFEELQQTLQNFLQVPWRILSQNNGGAAAARTAGLNTCTTPYLIAFDSDDIALPDFIYDIVIGLEKNPACWMIGVSLKAFNLGENWQESKVINATIYTQMGESIVLGQVENVLGNACAGFNVAKLKSIGGWGEVKANLEDWGCYLNIVSAQGQIDTIPKINFLYRLHPESISHTYQEYPGQRRLAENTSYLPRFESFRLQAMMRTYIKLLKRLDATEQENKRLRAIVGGVQNKVNMGFS